MSMPTSAVAARMKSDVPNIIDHNQSWFIKDRYIGEAARSIFDVMNFTVAGNIPVLFVFIDFQKAFDSLEWNFSPKLSRIL